MIHFLYLYHLKKKRKHHYNHKTFDSNGVFGAGPMADDRRVHKTVSLVMLETENGHT